MVLWNAEPSLGSLVESILPEANVDASVCAERRSKRVKP